MINDNTEEIYPLILFCLVFCVNPEEQVTTYCEEKSSCKSKKDKKMYNCEHPVEERVNLQECVFLLEENYFASQTVLWASLGNKLEQDTEEDDYLRINTPHMYTQNGLAFVGGLV